MNASNVSSNVTSSSDAGSMSLDVFFFVNLTLFLFGIVFNSLTFVTLFHRSLRRWSTQVFLLALSVVDSLALLMTFLMVLHDYDLAVVIGPKSCKFFAYFMRCSMSASYWIVVALTAERFLVVRFPLRSHKFSSRSINARVVVGVFIFVGAAFAYYPLLLGDGCSPLASAGPAILGSAEFFRDQEQFLSGSLELVAPIFIVSLLNAFILLTLATIRAKTGGSCVPCRTTSPALHDAELMAPATQRRRVSSQLRMTTMVVVSTCAIATLALPSFVAALLKGFRPDLWGPRFRMFYLVADLMNTVNHANHFLVFCIFGAKFRRAFVDTFRGRGKKRRNGVIEGGGRGGGGGRWQRTMATTTTTLTSRQNCAYPRLTGPPCCSDEEDGGRSETRSISNVRRKEISEKHLR